MGAKGAASFERLLNTETQDEASFVESAQMGHTVTEYLKKSGGSKGKRTRKKTAAKATKIQGFMSIINRLIVDLEQRNTKEVSRVLYAPDEYRRVGRALGAHGPSDPVAHEHGRRQGVAGCGRPKRS